MSNNKFFSFLCFMAMLLTLSCSSGDDNPSGPDEPNHPTSKPMPILLTCGIQQNTRVTDTGYENGDKIGLYVVNYSKDQPRELLTNGNHVDNMAFTYNGTWKPQTPIYWMDDKTPADFYAYYPYANVQNVTAHSFQVNTDQSTGNLYKASDFFYLDMQMYKNPS
ncbi:lipoprotein [gut metagenome]|uniref:Lipoprotein n=1 Tax=gut metagenome TaxID=749906 RepID=J9FMG7_9ZZZZ